MRDNFKFSKWKHPAVFRFYERVETEKAPMSLLEINGKIHRYKCLERYSLFFGLELGRDALIGIPIATDEIILKDVLKGTST